VDRSLAAMQTAAFQYESGRWSVPVFPPLDSDDTLVLVFGGAGYRDAPAPLAELTRAYPRAKVTGCSSAGEIHGARISDDTLSVVVVRFDKTHVRLARATLGADSTDAGASLARELAAPDLRAVLVFSDGLAVNGTALLRGIHSVVGRDVIVTGGLAADGDRFQHTWVFHEGGPVEGSVVAVGLYGDAVGVSHGSRGGWDVFGPERIVTRAEQNVLYELDGEPALDLYKKYLGDRAAGLPSTALLFPLALRTTAGVVVRTILGVDEATQSMTFAGDVPKDSVVQLMRANFDRLIDGAADAGRDAVAPRSPSVALAVSCVGRRIVLGERTEEEVEGAFESVPDGDVLVGFYSYGEISPLATGECGVLHNQTMTLTRLWET